MSQTQMLEWPALCEQVAGFASTTLGRVRLTKLQPGATQAESELLLRETVAAKMLGASGYCSCTLTAGGHCSYPL